MSIPTNNNGAALKKINSAGLDHAHIKGAGKLRDTYRSGNVYRMSQIPELQNTVMISRRTVSVQSRIVASCHVSV